jgi:hypothetical protein
VERYLTIENFKSEAFWQLQLSLKKGAARRGQLCSYFADDGEVEFTWSRHRLFDEAVCLVFSQAFFPLTVYAAAVRGLCQCWRGYRSSSPAKACEEIVSPAAIF